MRTIAAASARIPAAIANGSSTAMPSTVIARSCASPSQRMRSTVAEGSPVVVWQRCLHHLTMESITKPRLDGDDIARLIRLGLGDGVEVVEHTEFTDGYFNAAHGVRLGDGREVVLKVAPAAGLKLLRYEVDLMRTEIEFFERAYGAGVPLPKLWYADPAAGIMIMDRLGGISLELAKNDMGDADRLRVRHEIGRWSRRITEVPGELFGYPRRDGRTRRRAWSDAFLAMIADILADAAELERVLPRAVSEVARAFERHRASLDEVTEPRLIHYDLWDGNVFVRRTSDGRGDGWQVEGFIDGERAFYGDPIAELVSLISFIPDDEAAAVVDGFLERALTPGEQLRLAIYRSYLWLILLCEAPTRRYPPEFEAELHGWVTERLVADLAWMDAAGG
jgi:aminoglycoside phosphotransferase (APT) family kinase protein